MADEHYARERMGNMPGNTMVKLTFNFCEQQRSVSNQSEGQMKPKQAFSQMGVQDGHFLKEI